MAFINGGSFVEWRENDYMKHFSGILRTDPSRDRLAILYALSIKDPYSLPTPMRKLCCLAKKGVIAVGPAGDPRMYEKTLDYARRGEHSVWAADGSALLFYLSTGVFPDVVVSDLDSSMDTYFLALEHGAILVVQPHGDNYSLLPIYSTLLERGDIVFTSQVEPFSYSLAHQGFTDGDRLVYLAVQCGAPVVYLCCYNFDSISNQHKLLPQKNAKLRIARELLDKIKKMKRKNVLIIGSSF